MVDVNEVLSQVEGGHTGFMGAVEGGWQSFIPADSMHGEGESAVSLRSHPDIVNAKDIATLSKAYVDSQSELGRRVRIPGEDATPEARAEFLTKMRDSGVIPKGPDSPAAYEIKRPENLADGLGWSDEGETKLAEILHRHGAPKEMAAELIELQGELMGGAAAVFQGSKEDGFKALREEFGDKYEDLSASAARLSKVLFSDEEAEFFEATGIANDPRFLGPMMRLAPLAEADSSFLPERAYATPSMTGDEVRAELVKIQTDKTHPMNAGYWKSDPKVLAHIDELYKKAYGGAKVDVVGGSSINVVAAGGGA